MRAETENIVEESRATGKNEIQIPNGPRQTISPDNGTLIQTKLSDVGSFLMRYYVHNNSEPSSLREFFSSDKDQIASRWTDPRFVPVKNWWTPPHIILLAEEGTRITPWNFSAAFFGLRSPEVSDITDLAYNGRFWCSPEVCINAVLLYIHSEPRIQWKMAHNTF